jgi:hypothetical protein
VTVEFLVWNAATHFSWAAFWELAPTPVRVLLPPAVVPPGAGVSLLAQPVKARAAAVTRAAVAIVLILTLFLQVSQSQSSWLL